MLLGLFPISSQAQPAGQTPPPLIDDALIAPPPSSFGPASSLTPRGPSQFMAGTVAMLVVLPESDGTIDPSTENWTPEQIAAVRAGVQLATDWWTQRLPLAGLQFKLRFEVVPTSYEPTSRGLLDESLWMSETLGRLGYQGPTYFDQAYNAVNALRSELKADWGTVLFVPNSANGNGYMRDGRFAYAYVNGPLLVVTSDAGGYGAKDFAPVVAHELGHTFGALDQYPSARVPCDRRSGYLDAPTTNSQYGNCGTRLPSIMLDAVAAFKHGAVDPSALRQIGYYDSDGNGVIDPLDTAPLLDLRELSLASETGRPLLRGTARDIAFPSSTQPEVTLHRIAAVEYRVDGGIWLPTEAADGSFDSAEEGFRIELPLYDGSYQIELRAVNSAGVASPSGLRQVQINGFGRAPEYGLSMPEATGSTELTLELQAPPSTQAVQISEQPSFAGAEWQPFTLTVRYSLQPGDGPRTLYARFRDQYELLSLPIARTLLLDTHPPQGSAVRLPSAPTTLLLEASDRGSGVREVELMVGDGPAVWVPFAPQLNLPEATSDQPVTLRLRDAAGNISKPFSALLGYRVGLPQLRQ
jgi:hypothetical protein